MYRAAFDVANHVDSKLKIIVVCICATLAGCVESLPQLPNVVSSPSAAQLEGDWVGQYVCAQGPTAVRLKLRAAGGNMLSGQFDFGNLPGRSNAASGSFAVKGVIQVGRIELSPDRWLVQPRGYQMLSIRANYSSSPERLVGTVVTPGCSSFEVTKARA